jgi:penicillin-binding protein-related factor A (putative recombinase)
MATNVGKKFEQNFKASVPDDIFYHRLIDPPQSFNKGDSSLRFSWKNPCDLFLFNGQTRTFYTLELKTTGTKSFSFEKEKGTNKTANIHYHQIKALTEFGEYDGIVSGFIFNFRVESNGNEITYFQEIHDFNRMINELNKKSFNAIDLLKYNPIKIEQTKKKVNYTYNVKKLLEDTALPFD